MFLRVSRSVFYDVFFSCVQQRIARVLPSSGAMSALPDLSEGQGGQLLGWQEQQPSCLAGCPEIPQGGLTGLCCARSVQKGLKPIWMFEACGELAPPSPQNR